MVNGGGFSFLPPQKSRFFAISRPKVDSKKSVKYIFGPALTIGSACSFRIRAGVAGFSRELSAP
jgi:hypothetical protein